VIKWSIREIVALSNDRGYRLIPIFFPDIHELMMGIDEPRHERLINALSESGLEPLSLAEIYSDQDIAAVQLAPWDTHLNARGNQLVADRLYELLSPVLN
jgi:hypothetical protein